MISTEDGKKLADTWKAIFLETSAKEHKVVYSFIYFIYLFIWLINCLFIYMYLPIVFTYNMCYNIVCLFVCLFVCFVCLFLYWNIYLLVYLFIFMQECGTSVLCGIEWNWETAKWPHREKRRLYSSMTLMSISHFEEPYTLYTWSICVGLLHPLIYFIGWVTWTVLYII